jgi:molybdopterin-guanine dinucleotide biosynthesis protein A
MGRDKAFLVWREKPLWWWQGELMRVVGVERLVLSCRREQGLEEVVGEWAVGNGMALEVVFDPEQAEGGMVEALELGMRAAGERALVLSVDMPEVTRELIEVLDVFEVGSLFAGGHGPEPFPGIYTGAMMEVISAMGGALRRGLDGCVVGGLARVVDAPEALHGGLANWNRPGDVK